MDLAEFLLARIAEDEVAWRKRNACGMNASSPFLRLCAVWRRTIAEAQDDATHRAVGELRMLADQYTEHPDYRQEWLA